VGSLRSPDSQTALLFARGPFAAFGSDNYRESMTAAIRIQISDDPTPDIVHRFRNFGEDVYRALAERCSVSIEEIDAATTSFVVRDIRRQDLGVVTQLIKKQLRQHNFEASGQVVRL
jgi:hypothetical protein